MNNQILSTRILEPYNILQITIRNSYNEGILVESIITHEIPPCTFDHENWTDTTPDDYEIIALKEAVSNHMQNWSHEIKEAYKTEYLKTYTPRLLGGVKPLKYDEIEAALDELIQADKTTL
jgi:hypothetical protein